MTITTTKSDAIQPDAETAVYLFDDWFDPIEAGLRDRVRDFIETMIRTELDAALARPRYARRPEASDGVRHCRRRWPSARQPDTDADWHFRQDGNRRAARPPQVR